MRDTLRSIGGFWRRYDPRFFAQEIPCGTDYQLALPVPPEQQGVDYVVTYLAHLAVENRFLQRYPRKVLCPVWEVYCPHYRQEVLNLFEPVGFNWPAESTPWEKRRAWLGFFCKSRQKRRRPWDGEGIPETKGGKEEKKDMESKGVRQCAQEAAVSKQKEKSLLAQWPAALKKR